MELYTNKLTIEDNFVTFHLEAKLQKKKKKKKKKKKDKFIILEVSAKLLKKILKTKFHSILSEVKRQKINFNLYNI